MTDTSRAGRSPPKHIDAQYFKDGETWERSIARRNQVSRSLAWIVATITSVIALAALAALVLALPLKTYEPYMVVVDKTTGFVEVKRPMAEGPLSQDEAITTFNVVRYVKARETYDPKSLSENFSLAQLMASGDAARELTELFSPANPRNLVKIYGSGTVVGVKIKSVTFPNGRTALVRFTSEEKSQTNTVSHDWVSLIRFRYSPSPMSNEYQIGRAHV